MQAKLLLLVKTFVFWVLEYAGAKLAAYLERMQRLRAKKDKAKSDNQKAIDELRKAQTEAERDAAADAIRRNFEQ